MSLDEPNVLVLENGYDEAENFDRSVAHRGRSDKSYEPLIICLEETHKKVGAFGVGPIITPAEFLVSRELVLRKIDLLVVDNPYAHCQSSRRLTFTSPDII